MSKYNYNRKALKGLGVGPFLSEVKTRSKAIEAASDALPKSWYNPNELAKSLHPAVQHCRISDVVAHGDAKSFTLVPDTTKGTTKMAYFRAGQYVSVFLNINGEPITRPYTIRSNPKDALGKESSSYTITIKRANPAYASAWILDNWKTGDAVEISGPLGEFYYQNLKDAKHVVALAGGSGITPFYSMAAAIAEGIEDFDLTILYGSRTSEGILLKDELEDVSKRSNGRVRIVHVLSHEKSEGYEHGFLTAELIKKYAPADDYSVFMCGSKAMYEYETGEISKLGLKKRRWRNEMSGEYSNVEKNMDYPVDAAGKKFKLTVVIHGEKQVVACVGNETLLRSLEKAGIKVPSHCRSGECGWCHSRLISGEVYIPEDADGRRYADKKFGWIHPCCTFPTSDVELEVFS